jgi:transposase-like protein
MVNKYKPKTTEQERLQAVKHYLETEGVTYMEIAQMYGVKWQAVQKWVNKYKCQFAV